MTDRRKRRSNNAGSTFRPGARKAEKLRAAGDIAGARAVESELARVSWYISYTDRPGHTVAECANTKVRAEAEALLRRRLDALGRGEAPRAMERLTVENLLDDVLLDYKA